MGKIKYREKNQNDINGDQCTWRASLRHGDAPKGARSMYNVGSNVCARHSLWRPTPKRRLTRTEAGSGSHLTNQEASGAGKAFAYGTGAGGARTWQSYEMVRDTAQSFMRRYRMVRGTATVH